MIALIAAAAVSAAQPAPTRADPPAMQMGGTAEHEAMDCCMGCKDMADKHGGEPADHKGHGAQ